MLCPLHYGHDNSLAVRDIRIVQTSIVARSVAHSATVAGRSVLVTGGAGSFGQAFVRRCLDDGARRVLIFSRDEAKHAAMKQSFADDLDRLRFLVGDVTDEQRILDACRGVDIVIHAAALKRVETCEADPNEAVSTNVMGTEYVARACIERQVERAVFLSTDKAAHPNTLYGMTKAAAERVWLASNVYAAGTPTRFAATRYGNVIGSRGSVVPLFRKQAPSGVVTITDPRMTRFWMSMDEAVNLVVLALEQMRGGEVFVPKIRAAGVLDVAAAVAPNAVCRNIGLRPGEKLHETLVTEDEARSTYDCGSYYVIEPETRTWGDVPPLEAAKVAPSFVYRSDTAPAIPAVELRDLVAA